MMRNNSNQFDWFRALTDADSGVLIGPRICHSNAYAQRPPLGLLLAAWDYHKYESNKSLPAI